VKIELYESRHLREAGFFQFLFRALQKHEKAIVSEEKRPVPSGSEGNRSHAGAFARFGGRLIFFDMSDHVFDLDYNALEECDLYFKANYNEEIIKRTLDGKGKTNHMGKLHPFLFFPPSLPKCHMYRKAFHNFVKVLPTARYNICHIVGVYENPFLEKVEGTGHPEKTVLEPHEVHFWIRRLFSEALSEMDMPAFTRLTSRGNQSIEDGTHVQANINHWHYLYRLIRSKITVLNTYPHAVYPWKAFESLALGVPFCLEQTPLITLPEEFSPKPEIHYIEILPAFGNFSSEADLKDPASYRILKLPSKERVREGFERLKTLLMDRVRWEEMQSNCRIFAEERLNPAYVASWVRNKVESET